MILCPLNKIILASFACTHTPAPLLSAYTLYSVIPHTHYYNNLDDAGSIRTVDRLILREHIELNHTANLPWIPGRGRE
jgi:hypothetical protein